MSTFNLANSAENRTIARKLMLATAWRARLPSSFTEHAQGRCVSAESQPDRGQHRRVAPSDLSRSSCSENTPVDRD